MRLTNTMKQPEYAEHSVRLDMDVVRREFYAVRAMAALRQGLATNRVDWRIEPHWSGFTVSGEPGDPLIMPIGERRDGNNNLVAIDESFVSSDLISDLSDTDREWYSGLVRNERAARDAQIEAQRDAQQRDGSELSTE